MNKGDGGKRSVILAAGLFILVAALILAPRAEAAPQHPSGPDGWPYRMSLEVNSTSALSDTQIVFAFDTKSLIDAGKMRSDCGDLRVRTTGTTDVPYWIESGCNSANTRIWVRPPSIASGASDQLVLYYGNPSAAPGSSVNATFVANSIRVEVSTCDPFGIGSFCSIVNHTTADDVRGRSPSLCAVNRVKIEYGYPCLSTAVQTDARNGFAAEYRFLFVPDVSGTWVFETRTDNWSELATSATDEELTTSHGLIVTNYANNHGALTGTSSLTAGQGKWYSFVSSERNGVEEQRLRLQRPGGSLQVASSTNFPGMLFRRTYPSDMPTVTPGFEISVPPTPVSLGATPYIEQVNLTGHCYWSRVAGAACNLFGRTAGTSNWTLLDAATTDAAGHAYINHTDGGLADSTQREYQLYLSRAGFGDGFPMYINATTWGPPDAPVIDWIAADNGTARPYWIAPVTNGVPVTGYDIHVKAEGIAYTRWATVGASTTNHLFTNVTNGVSYCFRIQANSALGMSPQGAEMCAVPAYSPDPPVLTVTSGNGSAALAWTTPNAQGSPITSYEIWLAGTHYTSVPAPATSYDLTELTNGNVYGVQVTAVNGVGVSYFSNIEYAAPGARPDPPGNLVATRGNANVNLAWTIGADNGYPLTGYQIWRGTSSGSETLIATTSNGTNTSFRVNELTNGLVYFFNVTAMNALGSSATSNEVSAKPATTPSPVQSFTVTPGNRSVTLSWSTPASNGGEPITGYQIFGERTPISGGIDFVATITNTSFTVHHVTGGTPLQNGAQYEFRVRAVNAVGVSLLSPQLAATPGAKPDPMTNLTAVRGNAVVTLDWTENSDHGSSITSYTIYRGTASGATTFLATTASRPYQDTAVTNGVRYFYNVTATNAFGQSNTSAEVNAKPATTPAGLDFTAFSANGSISLSWTPIGDGGEPITNYHVWLGTSSATSYLASTGGTNASYNILGLTNGVTYWVNVTAANVVGNGTSSGIVSLTPAGAPYPPASVLATRGNGNVTLTWTPAFDNGRALTGYHIYRGTSPGSATLLATTSNPSNTSFVVHGLANGQLYYFQVAAHNPSVGTRSNEVSALPATVPSVVGSIQTCGCNRTVELDWDVPTSSGGEPITNYHIWLGTSSATSYHASTGGANRSFDIHGLTNGVLYYYNISAVNVVGNGTSIAPITIAPGSPPYPPGNVAATPGNASAIVSWGVPPDDGGFAIANYTVFADCQECADPAAQTVTTLSTTLTGLENGMTYGITVKANNARGASNALTPVQVTPRTVPDPPGSLASTRGDGNVTLTWLVPSSGGAAILGYDIHLNGTPLAQTTNGMNTSFRVDGLTNGATYSFHVKARNVVGTSAASNVVNARPARAPDAPGSFVATPGDHSANLVWSAGFDGGEPIETFRIDVAVGMGDMVHLATVSGANTSFLATGLENGVEHSFALRAANVVGSGAPVVATATPRGLPLAPAQVTATAGNGTAHLTWTIADGNGAGVGYHRIYRDGILLATVEVPTASFTDTDLTNGVEYTYAVAGVNEAGEGPTTFAAATPASIPDPPQLAFATRGDQQVALAWTPGDAQGSAIQQYKLYRGTSSGATSFLATVTAQSYTDTGLTNGVTYYYDLTAVNAIGVSARSNELGAKPAGVPAAPTGLAAARGNGSATLTWSAGATNGEPLVGYDILVDNAMVAQTSNGANTSFTVHGLTNGQTYSITARARNVVGAGALGAPASVIPAGAPYPPTLVSATRGNGQVTLEWTQGANNGNATTSMRVLQGTNPNALGEVAVLAPGATSVTRTGLTNGVTYYFAMRQANGVGVGNPSDILSALPATTPGAPSALTATRGNNSVTLAWTAGATGGEPLVGYDILVDGALAAQTSNGANVSFVVNELENGVEHAFRVRARNVVGAGALSVEALQTPAGVPNPPLFLSATRGDGSVALAWSAGHDQGNATTATRVHMGTSPGSLALVATLGAGDTSYTRSGLTNGVLHYFALDHVNGVGTSVRSTTLSARPATIPGAPIATSAAFGNANATLSWSPPGNDGGEPVSAYAIEMGTSHDSLAPIASIGANTTFVANGLTNGVTYFFRVVASNAVGSGPAGALVDVTPARAPDAPTALVAQPGSRQVSLDWDAPAFDGGRLIANYSIFRNGVLLQRVGTNTSYTAAGLVDGTTYVFTVAAHNLVGQGALTAGVGATPLSAPGAPASLTATTLQPEVHLSWSAPASTGGAAVQQYRIFASSTPGGARWLVASVPGTQLTYDDAADPATTRYYVVRALNVVGEGPASPEAMGATPADPLNPTVPDTYRDCERDSTSGAVACTEGSSEDVVGLAAGGRHTCALLADARVDCWGDDGAGQSGDHLAGQPALAVAAGSSHTCVVLDNGNVDCYGSNAYGKAASYLGGAATGVAAGGSHTCFLLTTGAATCQGLNANGQAAGRASNVLRIAAGSYHTCYLLADATVDCQGLNDRGQAADDLTGDAVEVSAGRYHTCVRTTGDDVRCWGELAQPVPAAVEGNARSVASGRDHACALVVSGNVLCWGATRDGQSAGYAGGLAIAISAGDSHACALLVDATIVCWGAVGPADHGQATSYPTVTGSSASSSSSSSLLSSSSSSSFSTDLTRARIARTEEA